MGMRGRDEHYKVKFSDFSKHHTDEGFEFKEWDTKRVLENLVPKMWSTPDNIERCPVRIFETF